MAKVRLTDKYVASISAPEGKRLEVFDQHPQGAGLMLRVTDAGVKTWMVRYRTDDGIQRRFSLGLYPDIDLAAARDRAAEARKKARDGEDPAGERRRRRSEAKAQPLKTLTDLKAAYFSACETGEYKPRGKKKRVSTLTEEKGLWTRHIEGELGDLRIEDVTPAVIKKLLRGLVAKGYEVTSNRVRALIRQFFNFAIHEERVSLNPIAKVPPLGTETPRDRVLRDEEMKTIWVALDNPTGLTKPGKDAKPDRVYVGKPVIIGLKLLTLLLTRRAEVAGMRRRELDFAQSMWTIPGERTKNGQTHVVPLPPEALRLIKEADKLARARLEDDDPPQKIPNDYPIFPGARDTSKSITAGALSHALRDVRLALALDRLHPHDLRRTAATNMGSERLKVAPFIISKLLSHTTASDGSARVTNEVYNLYEYATEKRSALTAWESLLLEIVGERERPENVRTLRA